MYKKAEKLYSVSVLPILCSHNDGSCFRAREGFLYWITGGKGKRKEGIDSDDTVGMHNIDIMVKTKVTTSTLNAIKLY